MLSFAGHPRAQALSQATWKIKTVLHKNFPVHKGYIKNPILLESEKKNRNREREEKDRSKCKKKRKAS